MGIPDGPGCLCNWALSSALFTSTQATAFVTAAMRSRFSAVSVGARARGKIARQYVASVERLLPLASVVPARCARRICLRLTGSETSAFVAGSLIGASGSVHAGRNHLSSHFHAAFEVGLRLSVSCSSFASSVWSAFVLSWSR